jgi:hypothetical protein
MQKIFNTGNQLPSIWHELPLAFFWVVWGADASHGSVWIGGGKSIAPQLVGGVSGEAASADCFYIANARGLNQLLSLQIEGSPRLAFAASCRPRG